ncbi:MAG: nucleotidyltransferase, partial [Phycisphaerae bacterium]|nr:nucleotidyltransferase [Phycisphaerae bacterium]
TKPWGTGHAVLVAADLIHEPFAAINADDFYGPTSYRLLHEFLVHTPDAAVANYAMVGFRLANTLSEAGSVSRGVCRCDETGHLQHIEEITKLGKDSAGARYTDEAGESRTLPGDTLVSMNMWGFHTSFFAHLRDGFAIFLARNGQDPRSEYYLPTAVNDLVNAGRARVRVLSTPEAWCGVTYQQDRLQVINYLRGLVENGTYPSKLSP